MTLTPAFPIKYKGYRCTYIGSQRERTKLKKLYDARLKIWTWSAFFAFSYAATSRYTYGRVVQQWCEGGEMSLVKVSWDEMAPWEPPKLKALNSWLNFQRICCIKLIFICLSLFVCLLISMRRYVRTCMYHWYLLSLNSSYITCWCLLM